MSYYPAIVLSVQNLTKTFSTGSFFSASKSTATAVNKISFDLAQGEIVGILGPNGAGKTTTLHMLVGVLKPTSGSIFYCGKDFSVHRSELLQSIGFASGSLQLPTTLSVAQNLDIYARLCGLNKQERTNRIEELLTTFGMWSLRNSATGHLAFGQLNRVILAKAFLAHPQIVFLDEATAALDPDIAHTVRLFLTKEQTQNGTTILLASHNMVEVAHMCSRVLVMKEGAIIADSAPEKLTHQIAKVRVQLTVLESSAQISHFLKKHSFLYTAQGNVVTIEIDEQAVAYLLNLLARESIMYSHISIDKPTLEDYFLKISYAPTQLTT